MWWCTSRATDRAAEPRQQHTKVHKAYVTRRVITHVNDLQLQTNALAPTTRVLKSCNGLRSGMSIAYGHIYAIITRSDEFDAVFCLLLGTGLYPENLNHSARLCLSSARWTSAVP
jgi:hypothetical protein